MISTSVLVISSASPHPSFLRYLIHLFLFHFTLSPLLFDLDSNHLQMPSLISTPVLYPLMYLTSKPAYQPKKPSFVWYQIKKVSWGSHELYPGHSSASLSYLPLKIPLGDLFYAPTDSISCNVTTLLVFFLPSDPDLWFFSLPIATINQTHRHAIFQIFHRHIFEVPAEFPVACDAGTVENAKASFPCCTTVFLKKNFHVTLPSTMLVKITLNTLMDHEPVVSDMADSWKLYLWEVWTAPFPSLVC